VTDETGKQFSLSPDHLGTPTHQQASSHSNIPARATKPAIDHSAKVTHDMHSVTSKTHEHRNENDKNQKTLVNQHHPGHAGHHHSGSGDTQTPTLHPESQQPSGVQQLTAGFTDEHGHHINVADTSGNTQTVEHGGEPKSDDIDKMHVYRDALRNHFGNPLFLLRSCFTPGIDSLCMTKTGSAQFRFDRQGRLSILRLSSLKD
jgi:hypothetical protein